MFRMPFAVRVVRPISVRLLFLFALAAATQIFVACHDSGPPRPAPVASTDFAELLQRFPQAHLTEGRTLYLKQCVTCHQADGLGTGNAIPPLMGHVTQLLGREGGKAYLARLGLWGLSGRIEVGGRQYFNSMPSLGPIYDDVHIAGALNYALTQWGGDAHVTPEALLRPEDIAEARATRRRPADNLALRRKIWPEATPAQ